MFNIIVNQLHKAGARSRISAISVIPNIPESHHQRIRSHFIYTYQTKEFGDHIRDLVAKSIRGEQIIIIRDIKTNSCAVFKSMGDAMKAMGVASRKFIVDRLETPYNLDNEWQFASINKGEDYSIRNLFPTPLMPLPDDFVMCHNHYHIILERKGVKELVVGYYNAQRKTGLTKTAFYNLLSKQGCSVTWSEYTAKVALITDMIHFPDYVPANLAYRFYKTRDALSAVTAKGLHTFGQRNNNQNKARIAAEYKLALAKTMTHHPVDAPIPRPHRRRVKPTATA